jgi:hypothetical protein
MEENNYWDIDSWVMFDKPTEDLMLYARGGKKGVYNVNHYSCKKYRYPKLKEGDIYWIDVSEGLMSKPNFKKCLVTLVRSGVVFYVEQSKDVEKHFEEFSLQHYTACPLEITVNLDPDYYEVVSASGKMEVNYIGKAK